MPAQAKAEVLQYIQLDTLVKLFNAYKTLYDMGYRGTLETVDTTARIDMSKPDGVRVTVAVGDVILYRTTPAQAVVACKTSAEFTAGYDIS